MATKTNTPPTLPRPKVEVLERALQNPFGLPSAPVSLTDPSVVCHWCNTSIGGHQLSKYLDAGYLKVTPEMIADKDRVSFTVSPEGYVTRGERHQEILMYTPKDWYLQRQQRKEAINLKSMNPTATRDQIAQAAAAKYGDEAAEFLHKHTGPVGQVTDQYERIERRPDGDES